MSKYKEMKVSTTSEEEDYYILQPMFQKLPPNEIISHKYAPDVIPQVKLITLKNDRRNNTHFVPPKTKNMQLQNYAYNFNTFDYLGNQYAQKINQVVYLKFNNSKYNLVPETKHKTRVMSAFYVPFQQLYSHFETTFTKNIGLNFPETHNNAPFPVAKANRGCCFDPIFCSSYQSANLFAAIRKNPFQYDLILQNDINSCRQINWFNFSVQFLEQGYYSFRIKNLTVDMTKAFQNGMKISYTQLNSIPLKPQRRAGDGWAFGGQNIVFTVGTIENEMKPGNKYYQLYFQFRVKNKHDIFIFALECPYTTIEAQKFFSKAMFKKARGMTKIQRIEYGRTISGSPLSAYLIMKKKGRGESIQTKAQLHEGLSQMKDRKSLNINLSPLLKLMATSDLRNKSVIVIGRLGASDVNTSFLMQGMIDYLLDNLDYDLLKRSINFYFVPLANTDGVKYGNSLTNLTGSDVKNDWKQSNKIYEGEIYFLKELFTQIDKQTPISLVLSLTTERSQVTSSILGFKNENEQCEDSRIFPYVLSRRNRTISFQNSYFFNKNENESICCVLGEMFPKAMIYQLNLAQFQLSKREEEDSQMPSLQVNELRQCSPDGYRNFGRQFLSTYLEHIKLYDRNILLRDKWIKEINEIEAKIGRTEYQSFPQKLVEERFNDKFYKISHIRDITANSELKTCNNLQSSNTKQFIDENRKPIYQVRREKISERQLPHVFNQMMNKRKFDNTLQQSKMETNLNKKKQTDQSDQSSDKPYSLFKITQKKTSILKNCIPNTLNFQNGVESRDLSKKNKKQRSNIEKQILKKQLSTKLLRKVKIEDHVKFKPKEKPQQIINNS